MMPSSVAMAREFSLAVKRATRRAGNAGSLRYAVAQVASVNPLTLYIDGQATATPALTPFQHLASALVAGQTVDVVILDGKPRVVGIHDAAPGLSYLSGTPAAHTGIAGTAVNVNSLVLPATPYARAIWVSCNSLIQGTVATDVYGHTFQDSAGLMDLLHGRSGVATANYYSNWSASSPIVIPAGVSTTLQLTVSRYTGTGTGTSFADGSYNAIRALTN